MRAVRAKSLSVQLFDTPGTAACQAPLSLGFSRQEYWSGLPCPPLEDLPNPGIKPASLMSPALAGGFFLPLVLLGMPWLDEFWSKNPVSKAQGINPDCTHLSFSRRHPHTHLGVSAHTEAENTELVYVTLIKEVFLIF